MLATRSTQRIIFFLKLGLQWIFFCEASRGIVQVACVDVLVLGLTVCSRQWSESVCVEKGRCWPSLHSTVLRSTYPAERPLRQSTNLRPWPEVLKYHIVLAICATPKWAMNKKKSNKTMQRSSSRQFNDRFVFCFHLLVYICLFLFAFMCLYFCCCFHLFVCVCWFFFAGSARDRPFMFLQKKFGAGMHAL